MLAAISLAACASTPEKTVVTKVVKVNKNIPIKNRPRPIKTNSIGKIWVVNEDNLDQFVKDFKAKEGRLVFIALSVKGYENIALNLADIRRYIKQQGDIIGYYEESIKNR